MKKFKFDTIEYAISIAMLLLMFVAIGGNIVMNSLFHKRFGSLEELGTAAYMFCCYAGFGLLYKRRELTSVTFVVNKLSPKLRWFADLIRYAYLAFFGAVLTYQGIILCQNSIVKKLPALGLPYAYLDLSIVFGFGMLMIRCLRDIFLHFKSMGSVFGKEAGESCRT